MSVQVERLKQQEEELLAKVNTAQGINPTVIPTEAEPAKPELQVEPQVIKQQAEETPVVNPPEDPQPKKKYTDWKKRFTNYKSSVDPKLNELRTQNAALRSSLAAMEQRMLDLEDKATQAQPAADYFEGVFSEEQTNTFGPDGLEIVKHAAKVAAEKATAPVKEDLKAERLRRIELEQQAAQAEVQRNYDKFAAILKRKVPDYEALDRDPRFGQFLLQKDPSSVYSRHQLFLAAESALDAEAVARHFIDFKKEVGLTPGNAALDRKVAPIGQPGAQTPVEDPTEGKAMSVKYITEFTNAVNRGEYRDNMEEARKKQAEIDAWLAAGKPLAP